MSYTLKFFEYIGFNNKIVGERFFARNREENKMLKKLKPILKISITSVLFSSVFIFSQDQCPPTFISGVPLNQSVALSWEKPDTLSGFGVEVYSQCFTTCSFNTKPLRDFFSFLLFFLKIVGGFSQIC